MFKVGSLFAGIGGFDLGLERAGMEITWQVEIDGNCRRVLEKHWPGVRRYEDIREVGVHNLEPVDLICGGFPCQPFSVAGKQRGKEDDRYLWPEMLRVIKELKPRWIIGENVAGLYNMGERDSDVKVEGKTVVRAPEGDTYSAVWTHQELLYLDAICQDLEEIGYDLAPPFIIPACAVNAPHRRDRVWIVAYAECDGQPRRSISGEFEEISGAESPGEKNTADVKRTSASAPVSDTDLDRRPRPRLYEGQGREGQGEADACGCCEALSDAEELTKRTRLCVCSKAGNWRGQLSNSGSEIVANTHGAGFEERRRAESIKKEFDVSEYSGQDVCHAERSGLCREYRGRAGQELKNGYARAQKENGNHWAVEPDVGRVVARLSTWMDGGKLNGEIGETGTYKILQALSGADNTQTLQWPSGRFGGIQTAEVLLFELCEFKGKSKPLGNISLESKETSEITVRGVWYNGEASCSSCRRESREQRSRKHPDTMHLLSRLLSCDCRATWLDPTGTPSEASRVDRLKGLGNAVVPAIPEIIGRFIMEIES